MHKRQTIQWILFSIIILPTALNISCKNSGASLWDEDSETYVVTDATHPYAVAVDDSTEDTQFFADVQADPKDLYIGVFNNSASTIDLPGVNTLDFGISSDQTNQKVFNSTEYNFNLMKNMSKIDSSYGISPSFATIPADPDETIGQQEIFEDAEYNSSGNIIKYEYITRLRKIVPVTSPIEKTLNIWVEETYWDNNDITQTIVDSVANKFLIEGTNNDIFDWVYNIFGEEWSNTIYTFEDSNYGLIDTIPGYNEINIVIADIHDNGTSDGVLGFFWSKDNFEETSETDTIYSFLDYSNERIIFYIEANFLSDAEYFDETISTLAHEFQHMINFYQTFVLNGLYQDTWLNELLSMATEDLLSSYDKLNINGPKGFNTTNGTAPAESSSIDQGRIPYFNQYPTTSYFYWNNNAGLYEVLKYYSLNYVYGAYLMRNFGGPEVLKKLYSAETSADLPAALNFGSNDQDATELTVPYANAAIMLSDRTDAPDYMKFNNDGWFTYSYNGETYRLSSINFHSYDTPFKVYTPAEAASLGSLQPYSFLFIREMEDISGRYRIGIDSPASEADTLELLLR